LIWFGHITGKYCWELSCFRIIRQVSDGVSFIAFNIDWDRYEGHHKPSFQFYFGILNCTIIEFGVYNLNHMFEEEVDNV